MMPACMPWIVLRQMMFFGGTSSMRGSWAARWKSASELVPMPGAMTPPRKSPFFATTSKVVAVPMSMTISGPPYCS